MDLTAATLPSEIDDEFRWRLLNKKAQEHNLAAAFEVFRVNNIEPIVIKGWAAARYYPPGEIRAYTDIDLVVSPNDFRKATELVKEGDARKFNIDLHNGLRHLDRLGWHDIFSRSFEVELENTIIRVPCDEDHLRILSAHWLIDGGIFKDRLWDIYYLVANRSSDFDWKRCLDAAGPVRKQWLISVIALVRDRLGLDVADLPPEVGDAKVPLWMNKALEKEWRYETRLLQLTGSIGNPKQLIEQLRRRIPGNPIAATVDVEGRFDDGSRLGYQVRSIIHRAGPSLKKFGKKILIKAGRRR